MRNKFFYISPAFLVLYNFLLLIFAIMFPPNIYSYFIDEKDYMFMNLSIFLLVNITLFAFLFGCIILYSIFPSVKSVYKEKIFVNKTIFIAFPLIVSEILVAVFILLFLKQNINYLYLLLAGLGTAYKENITGNFLYFSIYILMGIVYWAYSKYKTFTVSSKLLQFLIYFGIIEVLAIGIIMCARYIIVPFFIGLAVIFLRFKRKITLLSILRYLLLGLVSFCLIAIFRIINAENLFEGIITNLMGYSITSFNRLALILEGKLTYTYANTGYYLLPFLVHIPLLHFVVPNIYHVKYHDIWSQEFSDVASAQLNPAYIWGTLYGYIYSVLGYLTPIYFSILGLIMGVLWKSFLRNETLGIILYPYFFSGFILSFASNIIFLPQFVGLIYTILLLSIWEFFFTVKDTRNIKGNTCD